MRITFSKPPEVGYIKVTGPNGNAVHGGSFTYDLPSGDTPGAWTPTVYGLDPCRRGYHCVRPEHVMQWPALGMRPWDVEIGGQFVHEGGRYPKVAAGTIRLVRERADLVPEWWHAVEAFVASIPDVPFLGPQGDPDPDWVLCDTRPDAWDGLMRRGGPKMVAGSWVRDATYQAVRNRGRYPAWRKAGDEAEDAVLNMAGEIDGPAIAGAVRDAVLMASVIACQGLGIPQAYIDHAQARWDVWTRGYGVAGDVDGELYVYREL